MTNPLREEIRYHRKKRGYSHQELADELGLTASALTHKVGGKNPWQLHELRLTVELLGLDEAQTQILMDLVRQTGRIADESAERDRDSGNAEVPHPLADHSRVGHFQSLIEEQTRSFVGRDFVYEEIDQHLADPHFPSGYIVIYGEPGIGKTALLAYLVKEHDYIHHFNSVAQNIRSSQVFLANICAQLVMRYGLDHTSISAKDTEDSGFLVKILNKAVAAAEGDKSLVVVVDALDEAESTGVAPGSNRLYLPETLPEDVYFVVAPRAKEAEQLLVSKRRDIHLRDDDPRNQVDVRRYIANHVEKHCDEMFAAIAGWGVEEQEFIEIIRDKSHGNFMYLVYVLDDIRDGRLNAANVDNIHSLPSGLRAYYEQHWDRMRAVDQDRFDRYYEPVVCILATVREPVSATQITEWTKLSVTRVTEVISEWTSFLNLPKTEQGEKLYSIYHNSFQDFLEDKVGLMPYHGMFIDRAMEKIKW